MFGGIRTIDIAFRLSAMAVRDLWKTAQRVTRLPVRIAVIVLTLASVPAAWLHWLSRDWMAAALTVVVVLLWNAMWELQKEAKTADERVDLALRPDFGPEIREVNDLLGRGSVTTDRIDDWIARVYEKLLVWRPGAAEIFRPVRLIESPESIARRDEWLQSSQGKAANLKHVLDGLHVIMPPQPQFDSELVRLKESRDRLIGILDQSDSQ